MAPVTREGDTLGRRGAILDDVAKTPDFVGIAISALVFLGACSSSSGSKEAGVETEDIAATYAWTQLGPDGEGIARLRAVVEAG